MLIGYLYNSILPARAGEAARVVVLGQRSEAPPTEIVGTDALERLYDVVAVLLIFFVSEPWLPHVSWFGTAAVAAAVLALAIAAAAVVLAVYEDRPLRLLLRPLGRLPHFSGERLERTIEELAHGLRGLRHHGVAFEALLWTLTAWMVSALSAWLLTLAFPLHLPFTSGIMVVVAVGLAMILPAAPAAVVLVARDRLRPGRADRPARLWRLAHRRAPVCARAASDELHPVRPGRGARAPAQCASPGPPARRRGDPGSRARGARDTRGALTSGTYTLGSCRRW